MDIPSDGISRFFAYARARHTVYLRRVQGRLPPWTDDPILQSYRFTNIYRELDRTTIWCRQAVRERLPNSPLLLPAVVVFRWFNKIETGAAIFGEEAISESPFAHWLRTGELAVLRDAIIRERGSGPYVNGAYIIKSPNGLNKLDGVLWCCQQFRSDLLAGIGWTGASRKMTSGKWNLERSWDWLRSFRYQGDFMAYEVISDLRHTYLLSGADDIYIWANAGPGAVRGLNRVAGLDVAGSLKKSESLAGMQRLLAESHCDDHWPGSWGTWEMRDVEHTLCEYDKYSRALLAQGKPKQRYDQTAAWERDRAKAPTT